MIHSRAKIDMVEKAIERMDSADACLCNAALCNVLTKRNDEWLRRLIASVRQFSDRLKDVRAAREADERERGQREDVLRKGRKG